MDPEREESSPPASLATCILMPRPLLHGRSASRLRAPRPLARALRRDLLCLPRLPVLGAKNAIARARQKEERPCKACCASPSVPKVNFHSTQGPPETPVPTPLSRHLDPLRVALSRTGLPPRPDGWRLPQGRLLYV